MHDSTWFRAASRLIAILLGALALYRYAWIPIHANRELKHVEVRTAASFNVSHEHAVVVARNNLEFLGTVDPKCQLAVDYHMLYAANARILERRDDAIQHYTAALAADHRPEIYFERGMTYMEAGNPDAAIPDFALAARFNPAYLEDVTGESIQQRIRAAMARR